MDTSLLSMLGLGLATALTPCPLASNIAAILYLATGEDGTNKKAPLLLYSLGRMAAYLGIGLILSLGLSSAPSISYWLQEQMPLYLGPILVLAGMVMLDLIPFPSLGQGLSSGRLQAWVGKNRFFGSLSMGFVFALALCPPSAAILFGVVLPMAAQQGIVGSTLGISLFGLGTALPVILISLLLILSLKHAHKAIAQIQVLAPYIKKVSGAALLLLGVYLIINHIFLV